MSCSEKKIEEENQARILIFNQCANLHFGRRKYPFKLIHGQYTNPEEKEQAKIKFDQEQDQKTKFQSLNDKYRSMLYNHDEKYKLVSIYEPKTQELKMKLIQQAREIAIQMFPLTSVGTLDYLTHQIYLCHLILKYPIHWPPYTLLLPMFQKYTSTLSRSEDRNWKRREKKKENVLYWFYHHTLFDKHLIQLVFQYAGYGLTSQAKPLCTFPQHLFHWVQLFCHVYDDDSPIFWYFLTIGNNQRKCYLIASYDFDDMTCYMNDSNFSGLLLDASSGYMLDYVNWRLHSHLSFREEHAEYSYKDKILVQQILDNIHLFQVAPNDNVYDSRTPEAQQEHQKWLEELHTHERERNEKHRQKYPSNFVFYSNNEYIKNLLSDWNTRHQTGLTAIWMC
jgi:hypothetical protein